MTRSTDQGRPAGLATGSELVRVAQHAFQVRVPGPVKFNKVRDLRRLSCVMRAERFWTWLNETRNETD